MTAGQIVYQLFYRPIGRIQSCWRNGGPFAERETERHRREMVNAAAQLRSLPTHPNAAPLEVHVMTGARFWYQTAFCLHSLSVAAGRTIRAQLYDDGSIDEQCEAQLRQLGPDIRIHRVSELRDKVDALLPESRFPALHDRWRHYLNIRKLIDVHLGSVGWKLVMDSDLLFFRSPNALVQWSAHPDTLLHAIDCEESYGYSRHRLETVAGAPLPPLLNVGICGLRSEAIDWDELERWTAELQNAEGTNYYLEQALVAMLAAKRPHLPLPAGDYVTRPDRGEVEQPTAVMHHYVAASKRWYYRYGWRNVLPRLKGAV